MSDPGASGPQQAFDPYHKWLGISPKDRPLTYYRLLGVDAFEDDAEVISHAADQRMSHVRSFQTGKNAQVSQRVLNEIAAARGCLLKPDTKSKYDEKLRQRLAAAGPPVRAQVIADNTPAPRPELDVSEFAPQTTSIRASKPAAGASSNAKMFIAAGVAVVLIAIGVVVAMNMKGDQPVAGGGSPGKTNPTPKPPDPQPPKTDVPKTNGGITSPPVAPEVKPDPNPTVTPEPKTPDPANDKPKTWQDALAAAEKSGTPQEQQAILTGELKRASDAGDWDTGAQVLDAIHKRFPKALGAERLSALAAFWKSAPTGDTLRGIAEQATRLLDEKQFAAASPQFDQLRDLGLLAARKLGDDELIVAISLQIAEQTP